MNLSEFWIYFKISKVFFKVVILLLIGGQLATVNAYGVYTRRVSGYEVVVPHRTTVDGVFMSHHLPHHHRSPRDATPDAPVLHYQLDVDGERRQLDLWPSKLFLAPALRVERWRRDANSTAPPSEPHCHYRGVVRGVAQSQVAMSACSGLAGWIRMGGSEFWVEPKRWSPPLGSEHPHIVFRRSAVDAPAKKRKRKKKRRHEKNCGTREPPRMTETRLEWKHQAGLVKVKSRKTRWRRSVSRERHVEALLVADTSMMTFHQDGDVETYLLTIMNLVASLYRDPSIGHPVNVVVVRIVMLEDDVAEGLNVSVNAADTLDSFCKWQATLNAGNDTDPHHHDVAILITREDICARSRAPCSTLGVAHVAGMCRPDLSCNVNEDNGITLAHTIAHELGHNFGMYHDTEKIGCQKRRGATLHVMTPSFEADTVDIAWSSCSRRDITNFLDRGLGDCLEDEPGPQDFNYPDLPPGAMYDAEHQCRLQFGDNTASVCTPLEEICSRLWCGVNSTCSTVLRPAATGTHCGKHKWCVDQQCVAVGERPDPIPGGWGAWGEWSACSRTCGAGVSIRERHCDHPVPAFGGRFCVGERRRYEVCNVEPCVDTQPSFRAVQCSAHDHTPYQGAIHSWLPHFDKDDPCELYCSSADGTLLVPRGAGAADGTPCRVGTRDMCIAGVCRRVGCDWRVDSDAREDACGECRGDGSGCQTITGLYHRAQGTGYKEVVVIPVGSRNIKVEEIGNSRNYIGIGSASSRKFFLNGKRQITLGGEYDVAGTPALYEREREKERVTIPGPIKEDILIYVIHRGRSRVPGVRYTYTVPRRAPPALAAYTWEHGDWTTCTATCGGGTQTARASCRQLGADIVDESLCRHPTPVKMRACNEHACPARWWVGPWQLCPVSCHSPGSARWSRRRTVMCVDDADVALSDAACPADSRPSDHHPCSGLPPCPDADVAHFHDADHGWEAGAWSGCSVTCGRGHRRRVVECVRGHCEDALRPRDVEQCRVRRSCRGV